jgi:hypothetical protein
MKNLLLIGLLLLGTTSVSFASSGDASLGEISAEECTRTIQNNRNGTANDADAAVTDREEDGSETVRAE